MKNQLTVLLLLLTSTSFAQADSLYPRVHAWDSLHATTEEGRVRRAILDGSTTALSHFEVHASTVASGKAPHAPHVHDNIDELIIVKEGKLKVTIAGKSKTIGAGGVAFAAAGDEHGFQNAGGNDVTYYILKYQSKLPPVRSRSDSAGGSFVIDWNETVFKASDKGGRRDFFNRPTSQLAKFEMHTTALNPGFDSHAPHTHREEEVVLILKGNVEMYIDGNLVKAAKGDVIFLPSNVPHALKNTGNTQCEYFAFQWRN